MSGKIVVSACIENQYCSLYLFNHPERIVRSNGLFKFLGYPKIHFAYDLQLSIFLEISRFSLVHPLLIATLMLLNKSSFYPLICGFPGNSWLWVIWRGKICWWPLWAQAYIYLCMYCHLSDSHGSRKKAASEKNCSLFT